MVAIDNRVLHLIRSVYRLTLAELGALLDISESHMCRIERGERTLTPALRSKLVAELELTPDKLTRILSIYDEFNADSA